MEKNKLSAVIRRVLSESDNVVRLRPSSVSFGSMLSSAAEISDASLNANSLLEELQALEDRLIEMDVLIGNCRDVLEPFAASGNSLREMRSESLRHIIGELKDARRSIESVNASLDSFEEDIKEVSSTLDPGPQNEY